MAFLVPRRKFNFLGVAWKTLHNKECTLPLLSKPCELRFRLCSPHVSSVPQMHCVPFFQVFLSLGSGLLFSLFLLFVTPAHCPVPAYYPFPNARLLVLSFSRPAACHTMLFFLENLEELITFICQSLCFMTILLHETGC